jgi:hypothetical protein
VLTDQLYVHLWISDLSVNEMIKIDASTSDQPCASFGVNKHLGQGFVDLYTGGEVMFVASKWIYFDSARYFRTF